MSTSKLPDNVEFPWNDFDNMPGSAYNAKLSAKAIHEQLCVVADLLRELIGEVRACQ